VTYDLAVEKPALQIQSLEAPRFDNVFVCFGAFHIELAYFSSLGYIIEEPGGPQTLADTDVLASGSMNRLLSGKHFNRCKRLHPLLATAVRVLHIRCFTKTHGKMPDSRLKTLTQLKRDPSPDCLQQMEESHVFIAFMEVYDKYSNNTRRGQHGATAQFWFLYADLVGLFLLIDRACRTNDLESSFTASDKCVLCFSPLQGSTMLDGWSSII